jgi:predicted nucleic acid-binding protein
VKKLRIYLDTSVISHLDAPDRPDWQEDTRRLWNNIKAGKYEVFISPVVILEIERCQEPKLTTLREHMQVIRYSLLQETDEVLDLAAQYLKAKVLSQNSLNDCRHIAYACVYDCDMVLSWNFKHLVNFKTISGVKSVNAIAGYREMLIYTPTFLVEGGTEDDT